MLPWSVGCLLCTDPGLQHNIYSSVLFDSLGICIFFFVIGVNLVHSSVLINYLNNLVFEATFKLTMGGGLKWEKVRHELLN